MFIDPPLIYVLTAPFGAACGPGEHGAPLERNCFAFIGYKHVAPPEQGRQRMNPEGIQQPNP
jgi:hypothetical protein